MLGRWYYLRRPANALPVRPVGERFGKRVSACGIEHRKQRNIFFDMKNWFNELLQNAAFPAVALAFACAPINFKDSDSAASRLIDNRPELESLDSPARLDGQVNTGHRALSYRPTG